MRLFIEWPCRIVWIKNTFQNTTRHCLFFRSSRSGVKSAIPPSRIAIHHRVRTRDFSASIAMSTTGMPHRIPFRRATACSPVRDVLRKNADRLHAKSRPPTCLTAANGVRAIGSTFTALEMRHDRVSILFPYCIGDLRSLCLVILILRA